VSSSTSKRKTLLVSSGVAFASVLGLAYGLVRPSSLAFSIPFLIAPSLVLLWSVPHGPATGDRKKDLIVTLSVVVGVVVVVVITGFRF
jgi:hypothetical protein